MYFISMPIPRISQWPLVFESTFMVNHELNDPSRQAYQIGEKLFKFLNKAQEERCLKGNYILEFYPEKDTNGIEKMIVRITSFESN